MAGGGGVGDDEVPSEPCYLACDSTGGGGGSGEPEDTVSSDDGSGSEPGVDNPCEIDPNYPGCGGEEGPYVSAPATTPDGAVRLVSTTSAPSTGGGVFVVHVQGWNMPEAVAVIGRFPHPDGYSIDAVYISDSGAGALAAAWATLVQDRRAVELPDSWRRVDVAADGSRHLRKHGVGRRKLGEWIPANAPGAVNLGSSLSSRVAQALDRTPLLIAPTLGSVRMVFVDDLGDVHPAGIQTSLLAST